MKNKVVELVNLWADYEAANPDLTIDAFCRQYLADHTPRAEPEEDFQDFPLNGQLAGLIGRLNKYAGLYCKKALQHVGLDNIEDWIYLIALSGMGTPKKSELIYEMLSEFPSGIDIIKRLVRLGLVEEFPDEHDRRSKRVRISPQGTDVLGRSFPYMERVGSMAFDTLRQDEKLLVYHLLKRLDHHHTDHYKHVRNADFDEAFQRLVGANS
jgi:DNA-binding MarR family transcriptional regulator